jgi:amino acid transporter
VIVGFIAVAAIGIRESVALAAAIGAIEIVGLIAAIAFGWLSADAWPDPVAMLPRDLAQWRGTLAGAFIAFFAFIGFENLANLAEEVREPRRTLPLGILGSLAASLVLYLGFATAAVVQGRASAALPFLAVFGVAQGSTLGPLAALLAAIGFLAVANGVLVQIVMLARLFYGMADLGRLPAALARIHPRTQTPLLATVAAGAIVLVAALLVSFESLLLAANALTLAIFALVAAALWRIKHDAPTAAGAFLVPAWVPPLAAVVSLALIAVALAGG